MMTQAQEIWRQDVLDADLWHGNKGVIVNSAALQEREVYFEILKVRSQPVDTKTINRFTSA